MIKRIEVLEVVNSERPILEPSFLAGGAAGDMGASHIAQSVTKYAIHGRMPIIAPNIK